MSFRPASLLVLRHETFFSLDAMNAAIRRELARLNEAPMACGATRRDLFEASERAALKPLPQNPWEWGEWIERKVGPNCHVRIHRNHYSVPERHIGATVHARVGDRMVELFAARGDERNRRASPQERRQPVRHPGRAHVRTPPRGARYPQARLGQHPARTGPAHRPLCPRLGRALLRLPRLPRTGLRHRAGHDPSWPMTTAASGLEALCGEALDLNRLASGFLRERIKNGIRAQAPRPEVRETIPCHGNIRGGDYYRNIKGDIS